MLEALCAWFEREARDLPWRRRRNGYSALVAEIMLQQTQVSSVIERFQKFMRAFPTVKTLAAADEQRVLAQWQGMGYYRRARNLHAAAKVLVREFHGRIPKSVDALMQLPGVGRYTAGAIASIVFDAPAPIVDGNVERVLARVFAHGLGQRESGGHAKSQALTDAHRRAWAWTMSERLVRMADRPGLVNEALMELGATRCLPSPAKPLCDACPIARWCAARRLGVQDQLPPTKSRIKPRPVHHYAVIIARGNNGAILFEQRGDDGMWSGMWQTPTIESARRMTAREIMSSLPLPVRRLERRGGFTHHTTHRTIRFHVYRAMSGARKGIWRRIDEVADLPMSNAQRRVLTFI